MPSAAEVEPSSWRILNVLFDNGTYSVIEGEYKGDWCLGERWNGKDGALGFPNVFGQPVWHVVPEFLWLHVLHGILTEFARCPSTDLERRTQVDATRHALRRIDLS
jgi:hypothetical protein